MALTERNIQQRNGRIDRYGQKVSPQITTLLLQPSSETFSGDLVVLTKLLEREEQAHRALGDAASLMGKYSVEAEEEEILKVLAGQRDLDDVVADVDTVASGGGLARLSTAPAQPTGATANHPRTLLYSKQVDFLRDALQEVFRTPAPRPQANGVAWKEYPQDRIAQFTPPADLPSASRCFPTPTSPTARCSTTSSSSPPPPVARRCSPRRWSIPRRVRRGRRRTTSGRAIGWWASAGPWAGPRGGQG